MVAAVGYRSGLGVVYDILVLAGLLFIEESVAELARSRHLLDCITMRVRVLHV